MPREDKKTGETIYQTEDKQYVVKEKHINAIYEIALKIGDIIVNSGNDPYANPSIDAITMFMTTFVLDEDKCLELLDEREKAVLDIRNVDESDKIQNRKIFDVNMRILAKCFSEFDWFLGIKKRQEIMRLRSPRIQEVIDKLPPEETNEAFARTKRPLPKDIAERCKGIIEGEQSAEA